MKMETLQRLPPYLRYLRDKSNQLVLVMENFSGIVQSALMENGLDSTPKYLLRRNRSTLISYTSGHNTITIRTTMSRPPSKENSSSTTINNTSLEKMEDGLSKEVPLISLPPLTSLTHLAKKLIRQRLSL